MQIITDTTALDAFCQRAEAANFVTVDTEFVREHTYYPQLCLVQLATDEEAVIVDALAEGISLQSLIDLLMAPQPLKVLHACRQDMEIFYDIAGAVPQAVFDTQVAAMVCGFGGSVGYNVLVENFTDHTVDKSHRYTDWARRPLTDAQKTYALADVTHLRHIYRGLVERLEETGRGTWVAEEMATLIDIGTYEVDPETSWQRLKPRSDNPKFLNVLVQLAKWREIEGRASNRARPRVLRDDVLTELAASRPITVEALSKTRGISGDWARGRLGKGILDAINTGLALPKSAAPQIKRGKQPKHSNPAMSDLLKVLLRGVAEETGVAQNLIASSADIEKMAINSDADVPANSGWRSELFGEQAQALINGKKALLVVNKKLLLIDVP